MSTETARNLSTATVTPIQNAENTPRWLHRLLPWVDISGGVYRVNKRNARLVTACHVVVKQEGDSRTVLARSLRTLPAFSDLSDDL